MAFGIVANYTLNGIDSNGTHATAQITYWEKTYGAASINSITTALGITATLSNAVIATAIAADCNTQFGTSHTMLDVALTGGFVAL